MQENTCFPFWVGIDVSKDSFTAAFRSIVRDDETRFPPKDSYAITKAGVRKLLQWAEGQSGDLCFGIAMETTGVYSRKLAALIRSASPSQHVAVCNAASVSLYARSFTEQKSDRSDAELIARYACDRNPREPRQKTAAEARIQELMRERARIVDLKTAMGNSGEVLESDDVKEVHAAAIKVLEEAIENLENLARQTVNSSKEIKEEIARMTTAPGVAFMSAACIYGELGSLRNYTRKQISAMSGVCPVNRVSGKSVNKHTMSRRGSKLLRRTLFLDSNQAIRMIPAMGELHKRLLAKPNSTKMRAKCACMRKLLLILHAMVVNEMDFRPDYKSEKKLKI